MSDRGLTRLAVGLLEGIGKRLWGFPPLLMAPIVAQLGPVRAVTWFVWNMPRYERTLKLFGPVRTHLMAVVISLYNGCRYCAYGHGYALELVYFRDRDRLFPVDAPTLAGWIGLTPAELRVEVMWVDQVLALATGAQRPIDAEEARLDHLVRMFAVLNSVGIRHQTPPDEAHDPVNRNRGLKSRHAALRGAAT
jgi:hypothetical protein